MENAIYMSMRNDLSFLIDAQLSLYEHQSTYSPNLPLRFLLYLADLLSGMNRDENLYGRKKVERAIRECIQEGILKEFLEKNRAEAKNVSIYEYDQEKHLRQEREAAWEEGERIGREEGERIGREEGERIGRKEGREAGEKIGEERKMRELIQKKLSKGKSIPEIAEALEEEEGEIRSMILSMEEDPNA